MKLGVSIVRDDVTPLLVRAAREIPGIAQTACDVWAAKTQKIARERIQAHGSAGRTYRRRTVTHTASTPGSYPNTDTGGLVSSILVNRGQGYAEVGSAPISARGSRVGGLKRYGLFLETGTRTMAARPWLFRSLEEAQPEAQRDLERAAARMLGQ